MYMEAIEPETGASHNINEPDTASQQSFYPSFSPFQNPPLGHSRPFYYQQEGAYSQRPQSGYPQQQLSYDAPKFSGYKDDTYRSASNSDSLGLLGSGNFGVIPGGTFYDGGDGGSNYKSGSNNDYNSYYQNGHGRPSFNFGGVPNTRAYKHEQFANFRDFADINAPANSAYSQYVVVYVNKNGTAEEADNIGASQKLTHRPKNIIESLALLDLENTEPTTVRANKEIVPENKVSKSKAKLAQVLPDKKDVRFKKLPAAEKSSSVHISRSEFHEPLLALS